MSGFGFALLGPYAPWMESRIGYRMPGDIGGPMQLNEEYRWNIPVITYGFDREFLTFFGAEGVRAVNQAVAILNNLPPASLIGSHAGSLTINGKPISNNTRRYNDQAAALELVDLKSYALAALLEQMGLASPERYVWTLRERTVSENWTNCSVVPRNFDPIKLLPSMHVNGVSYMYSVVESGNPTIADAVEAPADPLATLGFSAVAGARPMAGEFFIGLTQDDVAGLRYLLRRPNQNAERLPAGVTGIYGQPFANRAVRPGVNKIEFLKMRNTPWGGFYAVTNIFTDFYIKDGVLMQQKLQRITNKPDILFRAREIPPVGASYCPLLVMPSDASRWTNYARLVGVTDGAGPGVILPGAVITFAKTPIYSGSSSSTMFMCPRWGSFDGSTNRPVIYPVSQR